VRGGAQVVIGVGNRLRGDDGVGLAVADRLAHSVPDGVSVVACELEPTRVIDAWEGADSALLVDAVASGAPAGTVHRFDASREPLPARVFRSSTHAFGVGETVELARAVGRIPRRVVVFGVEGVAFEAGAPISPAVAAAVQRVAETVLSELEEAACTSGC